MPAPPSPKVATANAGVGVARGLDGPKGVLFCSGLFLTAFVVTVLGRVASVEALSLGGAFAVVVFGVGAAPLQRFIQLGIYARLGGAILVGFSVLLGIGALMADVRPLWQPVPAAIVVGLATVFLHVRGIRKARPEIAFTLRRRAQPQAEATESSDDTTIWSAAAEQWERLERRDRGGHRHSMRPPSRVVSSTRPRALGRGSENATTGGRQRWRASLVVTLAGTVFWLVPALTTHDPQPGIWGFLTAISPIWYLGLATVVVGFAIGLRSELPALVGTLSFGLAGTLTPALVYATPRNSTAGKQMLLTQYVLTHHHIDAPAGIYQAFSALFAGMAWLSQLIGVHGMLGQDSLLGLATYWPVIFAFARVVELRFFAGRLLHTPGRRWTAVMLVLLVDTINDANYFSPQSVGYVMAIGVFALAVNGVNPRPFGRRSTFWLLLLVGVTLAPTHELTPYIVAGALLVLAVFDQAPRWSCLPIGLPALIWAAVVHNAIGANFSFAQLFDLSNLLPPKTAGTPGLVRFAAVGYQSHALLLALLILTGLAAVGFFANLGKKWAWGYALCPIVGVGLILINPYGNEGIFRSSLFAIPWMAVLAMHMPRPGRMLRVLARPLVVNIGTTAVLVALLATYVVAEWGVDGAYMLVRSDVAVTDFLQSKPSKNAFVLSLGDPGGTAGDLPPFLVNYTGISWELVAGQTLRDVKRPRAVDLAGLTDRYGAVAAASGASNSSPLYIFWSASVSLSSQAYAVQSASQMNGWLALLKTSRYWRLVKRDGDSYLFELTRD